MTDLKLAAQKALEAMEKVTFSETFYRDPRGDTAGPVIDALRSALQHQEEREPVAWGRTNGVGVAGACTPEDKARMPSMGGHWPEVAKLYNIPLYAAPPLLQKKEGDGPCWLVEKRKDGRTVGYLGHACGSYEWMPTPDKATRFVRREDANGVAECIETEDVIIAEHIWG